MGVSSVALTSEYGKDGEGGDTATTPSRSGLLARGKSRVEAARNLMAMIELIERRHGRPDAAPTAVVYENLA